MGRANGRCSELIFSATCIARSLRRNAKCKVSARWFSQRPVSCPCVTPRLYMAAPPGPLSRSFGLKVGRVRTRVFEARVRKLVDGNPNLMLCISAFLRERAEMEA